MYVARYSVRIFWNRLGSSHWSKTVLWAVKPWLVALSEDFARVAADFGPLDLAPLARAVSDFSCEGIIISLNPRLIPALGDSGSARWDGVVGIGCYLLYLGVTEKFFGSRSLRAGHQRVQVALHFHFSYVGLVWFFRIVSLVVPVVVFFVTRRVARELKETEVHPLRSWTGSTVRGPRTRSA